MQINYDINAANFMIREFGVCIFFFFKHDFWA